MNRRLAGLLLALAALPPAYACFVYGLQFVSLAELGVRLAEEEIPGGIWALVLASGLEMLGVAIALFIIWLAATLGRWRAALIALLAAWIVSAPLFWTLLSGR